MWLLPYPNWSTRTQISKSYIRKKNFAYHFRVNHVEHVFFSFCVFKTFDRFLTNLMMFNNLESLLTSVDMAIFFHIFTAPPSYYPQVCIGLEYFGNMSVNKTVLMITLVKTILIIYFIRKIAILCLLAINYLIFNFRI